MAIAEKMLTINSRKTGIWFHEKIKYYDFKLDEIIKTSKHFHVVLLLEYWKELLR